MKDKILVTGGAGYIGSTLVPELLKLGHEVTVVDKLTYGGLGLASSCAHPNFDFIKGDVRDYKLMDALVPEFDLIIPLAALVGAPLCAQDPIAAKTTNHDAPLHMFNLLRADQKVIMPTTNSAYGSGQGENFCDENSPLNPLSLYAQHKVEVEKALMQRQNSISFRLATVFGMSPRMRIDLLVNDFTYRAVHDKFIILFESHFKRNYIHVRDVAGAIIHAMNHWDLMKGQVYNVGLSEANLSKKELCEAIRSHLPEFKIQEADIAQDPDQRNYLVSNAKIEATGFKPSFTLDAGIEELIKGFRLIKNKEFSNV